ncbi:hypothetical protein GOZ89_01815 [Agrobacterium vitis]|uniref:hypothetical protein n=1 Tax=Agrobacterium vitis TaxID=373 RepID=UPI0008725A95|nr:hypothetical protein [Agrobacterium vitis]MCE6075889.1 hypothetical protein [Agrobacterium vitis]MCF1465759.1 hypothetical protein [Agrobacterium vitis]MCM2452994.1 hypothetical protein [Agrobacterium vitis]MCM2468370.1 hypothetical protein [Agrobacterium vitis]MUO70639.1 hypothetical protein [Agrobacterium vitis]
MSSDTLFKSIDPFKPIGNVRLGLTPTASQSACLKSLTTKPGLRRNVTRFMLAPPAQGIRFVGHDGL